MANFNYFYLRELILVVLSLLFTFVCFEIYFQVVYPYGYSASKYYQQKAKEQGLYIGRGGFNKKVEFIVPIRENNLGFNSKDVRIPKVTDCYRIIVVGDSMIESMQVTEKDRFSTVLESKLNSIKGKCFEVIPMGRAGTGQVYQYKRILKPYLHRLEANLVISALLLSNDIRDNSRALTKGVRSLYQTKINGWSLAQFLEIIFGKWLLERSKFLGFISYQANKNPYFNSSQFMEEKQKLNDKLLDYDLTLANANELPVLYKAAWLITETTYAKMNQLVQENAARFVMTPIPFQGYFDTKETNRVAFYEGEKYQLNYEKTFNRLERISKKYGITYFNAIECAETKNINKQKISWQDDGHWNVYGHQLFAECLYDELVSLGIITQP